jgi:hypothetical protein
MSGSGFSGGGPWLQIFGAIAQGGAAILSSQAAYSTAKLQGAQDAYDADEAEKQGQQQAALIRRAGHGVLGSQRAGYAASGVMIGEGSAGEVERETITDTEHDAFQAILSGQRQALAMRTQAKLQKIQAKAALTSTLIDPLASSGSAGSAMSGWKTFRRPTLNSGNSYTGNDGYQYANNDLSGTNLGSGD